MLDDFTKRALQRFPFTVKIENFRMSQCVKEEIVELFGVDDMPAKNSLPGERSGAWTYYGGAGSYDDEPFVLFFFLYEADAVRFKLRYG